MDRRDVLRAWFRILAGYYPVLSIEVTKECPLSCPGCYAYQPKHLAGVPLVSVSDHKGRDLVEGILDLVDRKRPLLVALVGGEPLVRFRELNVLLPEICARNVAIELVTSAVRPIPHEWCALNRFKIILSVDGLQPEHDARRKPATYERILKHIEGHRVLVHCTVTSQMVSRDGSIEEFVRFWSSLAEVQRIRISLFTPQVGETSVEKLTPEMRRKVVAELARLRTGFPKLQVTPGMLEGYLRPPASPQECLFARTTLCLGPDLKTVITPCQFGGKPDCSECGCGASMGFYAVGNTRLPGGIPCSSVFKVSQKLGSAARRLRRLTGKHRVGEK